MNSGRQLPESACCTGWNRPFSLATATTTCEAGPPQRPRAADHRPLAPAPLLVTQLFFWWLIWLFLLGWTLLLAIAVVSLYGQTRTQIDQQREQRLQLLAFADRTADLF